MAKKENFVIKIKEKLKFVMESMKLILKLGFIVVRESFLVFLPKEKKNLEDEVVVITGSGHGIGRQMAFNMAKLGAKVILWDINEKLVKDTCEEINKEGGTAFWYVCDVASEKDVKRTAEKTEKEVGAVTILINNAGIMQNVSMLELESERIKQTMAVNVLAHFWTIRAFLPNMEKQNLGHIVAISSVAGLYGNINKSDYSASKYAIVGLMESLSDELRKRKSNVKLTTVCPLAVNTGMNQNTFTKYSRLMPVITTEDAAKQIVNAIRKEDYLVTIPKSTFWFLSIARLFPRQVLNEFMDFTNYCQVPNFKPSKGLLNTD